MNGAPLRAITLLAVVVLPVAGIGCQRTITTSGVVSVTSKGASPGSDSYSELHSTVATSSTVTGNADISPPGAQIEITLSGLVPPVKTVKAGTCVTWLNGLEGTVTLLNPYRLFGGTMNNRSGAYSFTFAEPGTYTYTLFEQSDFNGKIIVTS